MNFICDTRLDLPVVQHTEAVIPQNVFDHCWTMYQQGQACTDYTAKEVFEQTLQSLAGWLTTRKLSTKGEQK